MVATNDNFTMDVVTEEKVILFKADGTPLKRQIGFAMQTTGTFPQLASNTKYGKGKGSAKTPKSKSGGKC